MAQSSLPTSLRIGPERHHYNYTLHQSDPPIYVCEKGSEWAASGEKLFLLKAASGKWTAYDACVADTASTGVPVFDTDEDATAAGFHVWRTNYSRDAASPDWRATGLSCETTILRWRSIEQVATSANEETTLDARV